MLNITEAAAYLSTSVRHMRSLIFEKKIPYVKIGGKIRFLRSDLDAYITANRVAAEISA